MALYKKEKVNPAGGCFPMLLQMPVFLALYWVLLESVEIRHSPWIFWIADLSAKDPYFILPIIMGGSMLLMQRMQPMPTDPTQAMVMKVMPIAFTFFFMIFPRAWCSTGQLTTCCRCSSSGMSIVSWLRPVVPRE